MAREEKELVLFTLEMEPELHKKLKMFAAMNGITMRKLITELIEKKIEKLENKQ